MSRIQKSTPRRPPPPECPLDECLEVLGKAWTAKILWFLREGPRRFGDLCRDLTQISPKVLTQRLRELERRKLIRRVVKATTTPTVEYSLTKAGETLSPVLDAMAAAARELRNQ